MTDFPEILSSSSPTVLPMTTQNMWAAPLSSSMTVTSMLQASCAAKHASCSEQGIKNECVGVRVWRDVTFIRSHVPWYLKNASHLAVDNLWIVVCGLQCAHCGLRFVSYGQCTVLYSISRDSRICTRIFNHRLITTHLRDSSAPQSRLQRC